MNNDTAYSLRVAMQEQQQRIQQRRIQEQWLREYNATCKRMHDVHTMLQQHLLNVCAMYNHTVSQIEQCNDEQTMNIYHTWLQRYDTSISLLHSYINTHQHIVNAFMYTTCNDERNTAYKQHVRLYNKYMKRFK